MIAFIKGILSYQTETTAIVEVNGLGYEIYLSPNTLMKLPQTGQEIKLFTYMSVKEDGISLYGFASLEEKGMFLKLLGITGIGPKGALAFLATLTPQEIILAILSADVKTLSSVAGIGKKTAQRVILELKDKFSSDDAISLPLEGVSEQIEVASGAKSEAIEALFALGYSRSEAIKSLQSLDIDGLSAEEILKLALKKMISF